MRVLQINANFGFGSTGLIVKDISDQTGNLTFSPNVITFDGGKVYIKTDVFQTYQFDVDYKPSWIEREMVNVADDLIGSNLLNEGLECGEYIENVQTTIPRIITRLCNCLCKKSC